MGLLRLTSIFGKSRQAWQQYEVKLADWVGKEEFILKVIKEARKYQPNMGGRKLHIEINDTLEAEGIYLGRDRLFSFLKEHNGLIKKKKSYIKTTNSKHKFKKHPYLIGNIQPTRPKEIWVADITYISILGRQRHAYLHLVTDLYSRKIVGWQLSDSLAAADSIKALKMALKQRPDKAQPLIHHSDRGVQYCCNAYIKMLRKNEIQVSMTESYDPYQNAVAERINGILKQEFYLEASFLTVADAKKKATWAIDIYNHKRRHWSLDLMTPEEAHNHQGLIKRKWKNYRKNKRLRAAPFQRCSSCTFEFGLVSFGRPEPAKATHPNLKVPRGSAAPAATSRNVT